MILTLHGATAPVHEYHTGQPRSFEAALKRLGEARDRGEPVVVSTVLSRSTFRVLSELPPLLASREVAAWRIVVPTAGDGLTFERLVPRLALALPFALHALARARHLSLPAWILGAPVCLLGPYARRALPSAPRAYGDPCLTCAARHGCPGVDPEYLERFGSDELRTLDDAPEPQAPPPQLAEDLMEPGSPGSLGRLR